MIDILCEGGICLYGIKMGFGIMIHLMKDSVIPDDEMIELTFEDGASGMIKKKSVIGFYESESTQA